MRDNFIKDFIHSTYEELAIYPEASLSDETLEQWTDRVGEGYLTREAKSTDFMYPLCERWWADFALEVQHQFYLLDKVIHFQFTSHDPVNPFTDQPDMLYLQNNLFRTGVLPVYTGFSSHPILNHYTGHYKRKEITANLMFRAVHDVLGHFVSGAEFNFRDEIKAYRHHYRTFSIYAQRALFCETMGQLTAGKLLGNFPEQKIVPYVYLATPGEL